MIAFFTLALVLAQPAPLSLDQIRADTNLEHRARSAVEYAMGAERSAEGAYSNGDMTGVETELNNMVTAVEIARQALAQTGKSPMRHPGPFKAGELRTREILVRLGDLERRMDAGERSVIAGPAMKVQEIHDTWFEGIMSKKK